MKVSDEKWNEIVKETEAGIARWNAIAKERGLQDAFFSSIQETSGNSLLVTRYKHDSDRSFAADDVRAVAREIATGQLRPVRVKKYKGGIVGFTVKPPSKAWSASLSEKPAAEIVKQLKLLDFFVIVSASHIEFGTLTPLHK